MFFRGFHPLFCCKLLVFLVAYLTQDDPPAPVDGEILLAQLGPGALLRHDMTRPSKLANFCFLLFETEAVLAKHGLSKRRAGQEIECECACDFDEGVDNICKLTCQPHSSGNVVCMETYSVECCTNM